MFPLGDFWTAGAADVVVAVAGAMASTDGEVAVAEGEPLQAVRLRPRVVIRARQDKDFVYFIVRTPRI